MKRISIILLCGVLINALAAAQTRVSNPGGGVQVVSDSNTENSRTMVISTKSGEEIEVTVTNLTALEPPPNETATVTGEGGEDDPIKITIYNYVQRPGSPPPQFPPPGDMQAPMPPMPPPQMQAPPMQAAPPPPAIPPGRIPGVQPGITYEIPPQRSVPAVQNTPSYQVRPMQIIPGLPNPNSNRVYYLQVGSFSGQDAAFKTANFLKNAGFTNVAYERDGYNFRVIVPDVPASMVHSTIQRLGALGIGEVWIR